MSKDGSTTYLLVREIQQSSSNRNEDWKKDFSRLFRVSNTAHTNYSESDR